MIVTSHSTLVGNAGCDAAGESPRTRRPDDEHVFQNGDLSTRSGVRLRASLRVPGRTILQ